MGERRLGVEAVHRRMGDRIIEEYTLLNVLPRDIADAHLSGVLHIDHLGCWVLKPSELMHDLRFFLRHGLKLGWASLVGTSYPPPKSLEEALLLASNLFRVASTEIANGQLIDFFNVFLAPFVRGLPAKRIRKALRLFILDLSQSVCGGGLPVQVSIGLELIMPSFLADEEAVGPGGEIVGCYGDFVEESLLLASALLEAVSEDEEHKPVFNPNIIVKLRPETVKRREWDRLIFQCHELAAEKGLPYFVNACSKAQTYASYSSNACRVSNDWRDDWELDTLRTGCIDSVALNLPRVSYDADGDEAKFFQLLDERVEMALRALQIKHYMIRQRVKEGLLPFLTQRANGEPYFRLENASHLINVVGLNESVQSLLGKDLHEDGQALSFGQKVMKHLLQIIQEHAKRSGSRTYLSMTPNPEAARRLARLDVERHGWSKVRFQGSRKQPLYTDMMAVPLQAEIPWRERLEIEGAFHRLSPGGHLALLPLPDREKRPEELLSTTKQVLKAGKVGFYAYTRDLSYCTHCRKTFYGILHKCPNCESVKGLVRFRRISSRYMPISDESHVITSFT